MAVQTASTQIRSISSQGRGGEVAGVRSEIEMLRLRRDQARQRAQSAHYCLQPLFDTVGRSFMGPREVTAEQIGCLHQTAAEFGFQPRRTAVRAFDDVVAAAALRPSSIRDGSTRHGPDFSPGSGVCEVTRVIALHGVEFRARR